MCGIHLLIDKSGKLDVTPIQKMINSTTHRGPDDFGFEVFESNGRTYYLGANRLKITDLSNAAHQPMHSEDRESALVFNGEIYNYQGIKNYQLEKGLRFGSQSDTEVVLNLLDEDGDEGFSKLHGMYAVIHFNNIKKTVNISRDPHGMKPLYYYNDSNYFIASSEIRGILATGLVKKELNETAVSEYLQYKYVKLPRTFFKNIFEVKPGTVITIDKDFSVEEKSMEPGKGDDQLLVDFDDDKSVISKTEDLLVDAVIKHVPQNQSSALFLSGGIDSTLLLAILDQSGFQSFPTYSFVASDEDRKHGTEDYKYSRQAAKMFHSHHHEIETNADEVITLLDDFITKTDQPVGDSAALMTLLLSKKVSQDHKVVLNGAGADELFGGYNRHQAFHLYLKGHKLLKFMKHTGGMSANMFAALGNESGRMINKFFDNLDNDPGVTYNRFITFDGMATKPGNSLWCQEPEGNFIDYNLGQALKHDLNNYLVSDVLALNDKMAMQSGVEMRMPYLDHELGIYLKSMLPSYLLKHGKKWILRRILEQKNGKPFVKRSKQGFGLPFGGWINKKQESLWSFENQNLILYKFVKKEVIDQMILHHRNGKANYTSELWAVLVLAKWLEKNFA